METFTYGSPCFRDNSSRYIKIHTGKHGYKVYIGTSYVQTMKEGVGDPDEGVLNLFGTYANKLKGDDKRLFKEYFNSEQS